MVVLVPIGIVFIGVLAIVLIAVFAVCRAGRAPARPSLTARIGRASGYTRRPDSLGRGQVVRQLALVP